MPTQCAWARKTACLGRGHLAKTCAEQVRMAPSSLTGHQAQAAPAAPGGAGLQLPKRSVPIKVTIVPDSMPASKATTEALVNTAM